MAQTVGFEVKGYSQFVRACNRAERDTRLYSKAALRHVGDIVKADAKGRFEKYDAKSAAGYRTYVRIRGIGVEQSIGKTTGLRPDFGKLQMRKALLPAADDHEADVEREMNHAIDLIEARFEGL